MRVADLALTRGRRLCVAAVGCVVARCVQCPIVERLIAAMMFHGRNNGKKQMAQKIVKVRGARTQQAAVRLRGACMRVLPIHLALTQYSVCLTLSSL
jgi:hypothetical protein